MNLKSFALATCVAASMFFTTPAMAEYSKSDIEKIVHDYILENPEILVEAASAMRAKEEALAKENAKVTLAEIVSNPAIPSFGADKAKHVIVEFFDYNCGYCKRAKPIMLDVLKKYPQTKYYYMEFPILTPVSNTAAKIGLAIFQMDPAKYVKYHDTLMTRNERLSDEISIQALVENLGLNWQEVKKLSDSKEVKELLVQIKQYAQTLSVNGTPAFFIDGEALRGAPTSIDAVEMYLK